MTRFAATAINLSELGPPDVIETLDFETSLAQIKADLKDRWPDFNVESLESDPVVKVLEVCAFREIQLRARVNDAARAVMLAFSNGKDLDNLGGYYGVVRQTDGSGEIDDDMRERIQLAPEAFSSAGPVGAYIFHARSASSDVIDALAYKPARGQVQVFVLAKPGVDVDTLLPLVRARVDNENVRPMTDSVSVLPAVLLPFDVAAVLEIGRGPDPALVRQKATAAASDYIAKRRKIGMRVTRSGLTAALTVGGVDNVRLTLPAADVNPAPGEVPSVGAMTITSEVIG
jgi:phage-related baseplate assembly protein